MTLRFERWSLAPSVRYDRSFAVALARATAGEPLDVYDSRLKLWFVLAASVNMLVFGAPFTLPAALSLGDDSLMRIVYAYAPWFADEQTKVSRRSRRTAGR